MAGSFYNALDLEEAITTKNVKLHLFTMLIFKTKFSLVDVSWQIRKHIELVTSYLIVFLSGG